MGVVIEDGGRGRWEGKRKGEEKEGVVTEEEEVGESGRGRIKEEAVEEGGEEEQVELEEDVRIEKWG